MGETSGWSSATTPSVIQRASAQGLFAPGTVLSGRYEIIQLLGQGGMGSVYKARDIEVDRIVALKLIRPDLASHPEILRRFKQELILAREVTHRNVIRIFDLGQAHGVRFITMEYVEGRDLRALLHEKGKLTPEEAVPIFVQIAAALEAAHSAGVVHRDLKPQNIMVDKDGRVYVMDFGVARSLETPGMTQTGALMGTPDYMSPEQAKGLKVDARSDLFSMGIIFYEMLSGVSPFKADTAMATMFKRTKERAVPLAQVDSGVPGFLSDVVSKCLEIDTQQRYQSAREIIEDLEKWQSGVVKSAMNPLERWWKYAPKQQKWLAAGITAALLLSVAYPFRDKLPLRFSPKPKAAHAPVSVLVADFTNDTADPIFDGTLEPTLGTALEGASFITLYNRGRAHRVAAELRTGATHLDEGLARLVGVREGVGVIITGSIAHAGSVYTISCKTLDAMTGKPIASNKAEARDKESVLRAIDELAARVRAALGDATPAWAQLAQAETFTASSLDAAHWYSLGQDAMERGQLERAIQNYEKTVQFDPNMGRAWAGMAVASVNLKKTSDADKYYKKTLSLLDRMTERERYRTLGTYYAGFARNYPQAIENYEKLTSLYPGDAAGFNNLSIAYVFTLDFTKARSAVKRSIEISPRNLKAQLNYALYSMYAGDFATAISQSERVIQENPSLQYAYLPLAVSTLARGDADGARAMYAKLEKINPETASVANIGEADLEMYFGHYNKALEILDKGISDDEKEKNTGEMALKYVARSEAQLARGKRLEAVKAAEKAASLSKDATVLYPALRVLVQAGEDAKASKIATGLDNTLQQQNRSYAQLIAGEIALRHKQLPTAVENLRAGQKLHDSWISHFLLGRAYLEAGHFPEAVGEFETCKKRLGETADLMFADTPTLRYLPPLYYWLARAQDGVGMKVAAQGSYQEFLKLRADADPGDLLVEEAKKSAGGMSQ